MLHVITQKFGRHLEPVFLSGVPSVRGFVVGDAHPQLVRSATGSEPTRPDAAAADANPEHPTEERLYSDYEVAYQTGYEGFMKFGEKAGSFEAAEPNLREEYEHRLPAPETDRPMGTATALAAAQAHLLWEQARHAAKTAWKRAAKQLTPRRHYRTAA